MRKFLSITLAISLMSIVSFGQDYSSRSGAKSLFKNNIKTKASTEKYQPSNVKTEMFSEDFEAENALDSWTLIDSDGDENNWFAFGPGTDGSQFGHGSDRSALSASWFNGNALNPDNWMISPAIDLTSADATTTLEFWRAAQDPAYPGEHYSVYISTSGNTINDFTGANGATLVNEEVVIADGWQLRSINLGSYIGNTVHIAFRHHNITDMFLVKVDDISVHTVSPVYYDIAMVSLDMETTMAEGSLDITGTIKNMANQVSLTTFDVTYSVDGEAPVATYNVSNVVVKPGETLQFTHDVPYNATAGGHNIEVVISNPNGNTDENDADNTMSTNLSVVSELVDKKDFYELFTSSTCPPCAQLNPEIDEALLTNNSDKTVLIKYQVNWPGAGDAYYTQEVKDRLDYYGDVQGVPTLKTDGGASADPNLTDFSLIKITNGVCNYDEATKTATAAVDFTGLSDFSGNLVAQMAIIEKKTTGNVGSNGETEFHNVMMKFLPGTNGNALEAFTINGTQHIDATASLEGTNVEEYTDLRLVVWVQNQDTKEVYQSEYVEVTTNNINAIETFENNLANIYPNPTNGIVKVENVEGAKIFVYNIIGELVYSNVNASQLTTIDLSSNNAGNYIVKIVTDEKVSTQKIVLTK